MRTRMNRRSFTRSTSSAKAEEVDGSAGSLPVTNAMDHLK